MLLKKGITFKGFLWQKGRKYEKIEEIGKRKAKIFDPPTFIDENLPWKKCSNEEFLENWEYKCIEAEGRYGENDIYISNTKDQETGYKIITPFYTKNDTNRQFPLLVERGWVPKGDENLIKKDCNKIIRIKGLIYSGDKKNKYT